MYLYNILWYKLDYVEQWILVGGMFGGKSTNHWWKTDQKEGPQLKYLAVVLLLTNTYLVLFERRYINGSKQYRWINKFSSKWHNFAKVFHLSPDLEPENQLLDQCINEIWNHMKQWNPTTTAGTTLGKRSNLVTVLSDPEGTFHQATHNVSPEPGSYEIVGMDPRGTVREDVALPFIERLLAMHTVLVLQRTWMVQSSEVPPMLPSTSCSCFRKPS